MYDRPLLMDVLDETGGNLRRFLTRVLLGTRDEGTAVDEPEAEKAAQVLFDASQNEPPSIFKFLLGVDPQADAFIDILTHANHCQIEKIDEFYTGLAGKSLRDEIAEMSMFRKTNLGSGEMNAKEEEAAANLQEAQHALDEALGTAQGVLEADEHCDVVEIGDDTAKSVEVRLVLDGLQNAENSPDIAQGTDEFVALEEAKVELSKAELNWTRAKSDLATAKKELAKICPGGGSDFQNILLMSMEDRIDIFAKLLNKAITNWSGADNTSVTRILGGQDRRTVDLIRERYQELYTTPLISDLDDNCAGLLGKVPLLGALWKQDLRMALTSWVVSEAVGEEMAPDPSEAELRFAQSEYLEAVKAERQRLLNEIEAASFRLSCNDARDIRAACVGLGTDEDKLTRCLVGRTRAQLEATDNAYVYMFGTTLAGQIRDETSGHYRNLLLAIVTDQGRVDALNFQHAVKGWGTDEKLLNELCAISDNKRLQAAKDAYFKAFDKDMVMAVRDDTSGSYASLLVRLLQCSRAETEEVTDDEWAETQAAELAGDEDDDKFIKFLTRVPRSQITLVAEKFPDAADGQTLEEALAEQFKGWFGGDTDVGDLAKLLVMDTITASCALLHDALEDASFWEGGFDGVNDDCVARILGSADDATLDAIQDTYRKVYAKPLEEVIDAEIGDGLFFANHFKKAALRWLTYEKVGMEDFEHRKELEDAGLIDEIPFEERDVMSLAEDINQNKLTPKQLRIATSKLHGELVEALDYIANYDAGEINKACRGLGTDDSTLVNILTGRSKAQLQRIDRQYQLRYDHCLVEEIESETGGDYKEFLSAMVTEKSKLAARGLRAAMEGWGTDDKALIEVICTRNNPEIRKCKKAYNRLYDKPLSVDVRKETSGNYKKILTRLLEGRREEWLVPDEPLAEEQAQLLYGAGSGRWGTDENKFIEILTKSSPAQIACIGKHYEQMYGESLDDAITSEFSGDEGRCLRMLSKDRLGVWATLVHKALTEGRLSADKEVLVRILGGADKGTVKAIARRYQQLFGAPLVLDLQEKLSGVLSGGLKAALISWVENEAIGEEERPPDPNLTPCEDATIEYFRVHSLLVNALDYITRIDAKRIRAACKGFGTDDEALIRILTSRTKDQLQRLDDTYVMRYGMTLIGQIADECFSFFGLAKSAYQEMMENILRDAAKVDAMNFRKAIKGLGTNEALLTELVCTRSNKQLRAAQKAYELVYGRDLAQDVKDDTSGTYKHCPGRL